VANIQVNQKQLCVYNFSVFDKQLLCINQFFRPLFEEDIEIADVAETLWKAPFAVLAHDTSEPEPCFVYGNQVS
jgi:hypothetical protein